MIGAYKDTTAQPHIRSMNILDAQSHSGQDRPTGRMSAATCQPNVGVAPVAAITVIAPLIEPCWDRQWRWVVGACNLGQVPVRMVKRWVLPQSNQRQAGVHSDTLGCRRQIALGPGCKGWHCTACAPPRQYPHTRLSLSAHSPVPLSPCTPPALHLVNAVISQSSSPANDCRRCAHETTN